MFILLDCGAKVLQKKRSRKKALWGGDSYPEVTIAMEWEEEKSGVNSD